MSERPDLTGVELDTDRLTEIRNLLTNESSISFTSARAHESVWALLALAEEMQADGPACDGYCPMGCGRTMGLYRFVAGWGPRCNDPDCPRPAAVHMILSDPETEHIVHIGPSSYSARHPLKERLPGGDGLPLLLNCDVGGYIDTQHLLGKLPEPGTYRVVDDQMAFNWRWERLDAKT